MSKRMTVYMTTALLMAPGLLLAADTRVPLDQVQVVPAEDAGDAAVASSPDAPVGSLDNPAPGQSLERGDSPRIGDDASGEGGDAGSRME
ncbi:hypothetical protein RM531_14160 [Salinisphaera sp. P385]|uniref:Uncharacterized protein n=1 Tax=Spectribacter acetivorans TaxID=3075603 RepID=A0ABU3BDS7_9GAMM|nr:hypothetical protein [Salinisphaera sp. P385]MDT0619618.1 hypothetical protein [Salinisphaera sp. P385]